MTFLETMVILFVGFVVASPWLDRILPEYEPGNERPSTPKPRPRA